MTNNQACKCSTFVAVVAGAEFITNCHEAVDSPGYAPGHALKLASEIAKSVSYAAHAADGSEIWEFDGKPHNTPTNLIAAILD